MSSPDNHKWKDAIKKDIDSLSENDVWDLIDLPEGKQVIGSVGAEPSQQQRRWLRPSITST